MTLPLPEYRVTRLLRESGHSRVFEAESERDGRRVIAKVFDLEGEDVEDRVIHEFELIRSLDVDGVVEARELRRVGDQLVLVLEHVPGVDLKELARGAPLELERFWSIAIEVAEILAQTHARKVIHRDIKPTNVLVDDEGRVHLADFGISVLLESERRYIYDDSLLVGTLPYISPEQTGRTNRTVDFRSDLYSLGATFYELLTGRQPFDCSAPLELIHAHLARVPVSPRQIRPELPDALSRLVMRLLAKAPEHRYQTAAGLAVDLRRIRARVEAGDDTSGFELGQADLSKRLQLPHQLYGREREAEALLEAYRATVESGGRRALLVAGPAGIGKSALTSVLEVAVAGGGGYLARGKFDAVGEKPYAGFVEALTGLFEQFLTESDARLAIWRRRLIEGLGGLVSVVCELVPALALIVGEQVPAPSLGLLEARNRIQIAMERVVATLCEGGRPLVLVLDDLQRAERGSVALVETLLSSEVGPLLIVGTVRAHELDEAHPLAALMREQSSQLSVLTLESLTSEAIRELLSAALARPSAQVEALAEIVAHKTGGVPLFVRQFLAELVERELLRPSPSTWTWDEVGVAAARIPDDAVEMMSAKLDALSAEHREVLGRAACLGSRFELGGLTLVCEQPRTRLAAICYELVDAGLLSDLGVEYRFAHDTLRAAALRTIPADRQRSLHWTIGQHRLADLDDSDEWLFVVVDHLDAGTGDELDAAGRIELAALDLRAGQRALDSAAYEMAARYLGHGLELVADAREAVIVGGPRAPNYELVFELHFAHAQAQALTHARERANQEFDELLGWRLADHHHARVVARRVRLLYVEGRVDEGIELGLAALARWGYAIPRTPSRPRALHSLVRAWWWLRSLDSEEVLAIPSCRDEHQAAMVDIVSQIKYPAFTTDKVLFIYLAGLHVRMLQRYGFHESTPSAIADLAVGVSGGLGKIDDAIAFVDRAFALCERLPNSQIVRLGVVVPASVLVLHRGRAFADTLRLLERSYPIALESGDFHRASYIAAFALVLEIEVGTHLGVVHRRARELGSELGRWGSRPPAMNIWVQRCWCVAMLRADVDPDEVEVRAITPELIRRRGGLPTTEYIWLVNLAMLDLLLGDRRRVVYEHQGLVGGSKSAIGNTWFLPRAALIMVVAVEGQRMHGEPIPAAARKEARKSLRLLARWAKAGPDNYGHYHELALGVSAAARGSFDEALVRLEQAWAAARQRGCRWVEGLAAEYSAELLERRGLDLLVIGAWRRTWDAYAAWGATAKLDQLRARKPELFEEPISSGRPSAARSMSTMSLSEGSSTPSLDLEGVLRSVGVITEELGLEVVIGRLLDAALTSAGADHGMLVLEREGELAVVATHTNAGEPELIPELLRLREAGARAPTALVNFVVRTSQWLVLDDALADPRFASDPYLLGNGVRSVLALPIIKASRQLGVLVLENRLTTHGFTSAVIETLRLITGQAASILDNARLYAALRRSEARWRSLVDGAPDVIALLDEAGSMVFANRHGPFASLEPGSSAASEGTPSPSSAASWREAVTFVLEHGQPRELELEFELACGQRSWYAVRIAPIEPESEGPVRRNAVAVARDISDRKRAEAERNALEIQLRQQQRLESIGTLASGVAHEINNPIQGIMNYADLIGTNSATPDVVEEFAGEIIQESQRVATIVRNLLAFARHEAEQQQEMVEPGRLIEATLSLIQSVLRKDHITLGVSLGDRSALVHCRPQQIQQILMNLVTNARDAVNQRHGFGDDADRKRIGIRVERIERDEQAWVRVVVEDSGPGIPAQVLPRIFDPFFTTKGRHEGTGLGLAMSHRLARDNGGELSLETRVGEGTRFFLDLPAAEVVLVRPVESRAS